MGLLILLYTVLGIFSSILFFIYWKFIHQQKRIYNILRSQGVPCEPFIPIVGQLPSMLRASEKGTAMNYRMELVRKHGYFYGICIGPAIYLIVLEPDMIADIFGPSHVQDYLKLLNIDKIYKPLIGVHNLLVSEGTEHERARKMLNPAFHFVKLQSMISIMVDKTSEGINELLLLSTE